MSGCTCPFCGSSGFTVWLSYRMHGTRKLHACAHPYRDVKFLAMVTPMLVFTLLCYGVVIADILQ